MTDDDRSARPTPVIDDVISSQRACRQFSDDPLSDEVVTEILEMACKAPSSENAQPWRFVVVRDPARRAELGRLMREIWEAGGRDYTRDRVDGAVFAAVDGGLRGGGLASAPVMIVVGGDSTAVHRPHLKSSVYPAVQNLLLAATARGLGSCLTTIANFRSDDVRDFVGFPPEIDPLAVVPVGHPARPLGPPRRDSAASKTSRDRYGESWG